MKATYDLIRPMEESKVQMEVKTDAEIFDEKFASLNNFYNQPKFVCNIPTEFRYSAAERAYMKEDERLTERLELIQERLDRAKIEIEKTRKALEGSEKNCNNEMARINEDLDNKLKRANDLFKKNQVTNDIIRGMAAGKFRKRI